MDIWQRLLQITVNIPASNWGVVGRWSYYGVTKGALINPAIDDMPALAGEVKLGWIVHYLVGIGYAIAYWVLAENLNMLSYNWQDGLIFGIASSFVPWCFFPACPWQRPVCAQHPNPAKSMRPCNAVTRCLRHSHGDSISAVLIERSCKRR
jgi:hypothetical protein